MQTNHESKNVPHLTSNNNFQWELSQKCEHTIHTIVEIFPACISKIYPTNVQYSTTGTRIDKRQTKRIVK